MLTISLHQLKIHAPHGLYPQEQLSGNLFETDVDLFLPDTQPYFSVDGIASHVIEES